MVDCANIYVEYFLKSIVEAFRRYRNDVFEIYFPVRSNYVIDNDKIVSYLLVRLKESGFEVNLSSTEESMNKVCVKYWNKTVSKSTSFELHLSFLSSLLELSAKTNISVCGIVLMKIIAKLIADQKTMYKAIVLDLDDTLWPGTLSEDGINKIKENMLSDVGKPYISFMKYIKILGEELGIFVAICSTNEIDKVTAAIEELGEELFPLKGQIDCLVADQNEKSQNLKLIASQLSILPNAMVFVDDNPIVRDLVKENLPEVSVPIWINHDELLTSLLMSSVFDRSEISVSFQRRRHQLKILKTEKSKNPLPNLYVKISKDPVHTQAKSLYKKTNQFKLVDDFREQEGHRSLSFEMFRENGGTLGICSAITYYENEEVLCVCNWALSCRFFRIGLEEFIILYLKKIAGKKKISFHFVKSEQNQKVRDLFSQYPELFIQLGALEDNILLVNLEISKKMGAVLKRHTNLKIGKNGK